MKSILAKSSVYMLLATCVLYGLWLFSAANVQISYDIVPILFSISNWLYIGGLLIWALTKEEKLSPFEKSLRLWSAIIPIVVAALLFIIVFIAGSMGILPTPA